MYCIYLSGNLLLSLHFIALKGKPYFKDNWSKNQVGSADCLHLLSIRIETVVPKMMSTVAQRFDYKKPHFTALSKLTVQIKCDITSF